MKVSSTIKKMVVVSVFCSQVLTLLPMDKQVSVARPARGLSLMSMASNVTLPTGEVPEFDEPKERDIKAEQAARQTRLQTLFGGEGDTIINIPTPDQDEQNPANLDEARKVAIAQDEDKDTKLVRARDERQRTLTSRLSLDDVAAIAPMQGTLTVHPSAIELECREHAIDISVAPTQADVDAKVEKVRQETNKINKLIEDIKQLMSKAKGHVVKGIERGAYLIIAGNIVMFVWTTIDSAQHTETLPYVSYIAVAAYSALVATAEILHAIHNKLKQEVENDEFIPEDQPSSIPQSATLSFRQRLSMNCSNCWSKVTNCLSKIAATHLITGFALASAGITFTAAQRPDAIPPLAAEWIGNGEDILSGILTVWTLISKNGINKLYAIRAKREAQRRHGSVGGTVHQTTELQQLSPKLKVSIEPKVEEVRMTVNPLVADEQLTIETGEKTESDTPTPTKDTPEKRDSSEEPTPELTAAQKKLDFKQPEAEIAV